jgi:hypothetical protein
VCQADDREVSDGLYLSGAGYARLFAVLATVVAAFILIPSSNTEASNCPPAAVAKFYTSHTNFVPKRLAGSYNPEGRREELIWCGDRVRPFVFVGDAILIGAWLPLGLLSLSARRRGAASN